MDKAERIYLAYLTEPREVGVSTPHSPQHLTLVPPFLAKPKIAIEAARTARDNIKQFPVRIGEIALLGPNQDIKVYTVEPIALLAAVHNLLMDELENRAVDTSRLGHTRDQYMPHITIKPNHSDLKKGQRLDIDHIAIMQKTDKQRTLLAKEYLEQ